MFMDTIYYIILGVTVISYLLGLFLSYFEKKGKISVLSGMGNAGFINIFGVTMDPPKESYLQDPAMKRLEEKTVIQQEQAISHVQEASCMDEEIL